MWGGSICHFLVFFQNAPAARLLSLSASSAECITLNGHTSRAAAHQLNLLALEASLENILVTPKIWSLFLT